MESRIANILNRMNEENYKFKELKRNYMACKTARKATYIRVSAHVYPENNNGFSDSMTLKLEGEIAEKIIDLIEFHYIQLGNQCKENLEDMVKEMKEGSENE